MKVSVIIPYVNDRGYLKEAIDSVRAQTHRDYEIILSQSPNRVGYNINRGVEKAKGVFIKWLCDDDMLTPNSLMDSVEAMGDNDFIHGNAINFRGTSQSVHIPELKTPTLSRLLSKNHIHGGTVMYRKDCFERFGMFDESLWTGEELDYHLMLLSKGAKIGYCDSVLYLYRRHAEQKSTGKSTAEYKERRVNAIKEIRNRYR